MTTKQNMMRQLFLCVMLLCLVSEGAPYAGHDAEDVQIIWVDLGSNLTIPCGSFSSSSSSSLGGSGGQSVMWIHEGRGSPVTNHVQKDGSIFFQHLQLSDSGIYSCSLEYSDDESSSSSSSRYKSAETASNFQSTGGASGWTTYETRFHIRIRTQPQVLKNVTVKPFTILALVMWEVDEKDGNGGYPIKNFYISYRLKNSTIGDWQQCPLIHISPELRQYQIYHLHPNSTYLIQVWATNKLGKGPSTIVECSTHSNPQEIELGKRFLDGVDTFDVRIWIIAVAIVISTLCILGIATCCLFYKEYVVNLANQSSTSRDEHIELMPNIILNPGYDFQSMDLQEPDENSNDTNAPVRLNNNSVIYPARV